MNDELLAEKVSNRRVEIGLSTAEAARQAGIGRATWRGLESGEEREQLSARVARGVDQALGWMPGSTAGIWREGPDYVVKLDDKRVLVAEIKSDVRRWDIGDALDEVIAQITAKADSTFSGRGDWDGFARRRIVMDRVELLTLFNELSNQQRHAVMTIMRAMHPEEY